MDESQRHAAGMKTRRAVLSDAYVDKASAGITDQNQLNAIGYL